MKNEGEKESDKMKKEEEILYKEKKVERKGQNSNKT